MQRNELNYWNGKVQNMRRDMDLQQNFNQKLVHENRTLKSDIEDTNRQLQLHQSKEQTLGR